MPDRSSATRTALRKRKQKRARVHSLEGEKDTEQVRLATRLKLAQSISPDQADQIAKEIEQHLFETYKGTGSEYRTSFRRLFTALKKENATFAKRLLDKSLDPLTFAGLSVEELKSDAQKEWDQQIHSDNLKKSVAQTLLPENIQQVKDGRDREKWGVSRSAAALDD